MVDRASWELGAEDAPAIASFLVQLGYPTTTDQLVARLERLHGTSHTLVGDRVDGQVVAFAAGRLDWTLQRDEPVGRVTALAVHPDHQREGRGARQLRRIEGWARDHGARQVTVNSGSHRRGAHRFYLAQGYTETGTRFGRDL